MKTGIFGGAFDPIHKGHIYMAQKAMEEYSLDRILLVPSGHSPNKTENAMTAFSHRYNMCKLASEAVPGIEVSDIEIKDESTSYTYVTLQKLKQLYPEDELYFIMGGDSLDYFETWMRPDVIAQTAIILVMVRENFPKLQMEEKIAHIKNLFPADIRLLKCDRMDVSSTQVRRLLRAKSQADGYRSPKGAEMFLDAAAPINRRRISASSASVSHGRSKYHASASSGRSSPASTISRCSAQTRARSYKTPSPQSIDGAASAAPCGTPYSAPSAPQSAIACRTVSAQAACRSRMVRS